MGRVAVGLRRLLGVSDGQTSAQVTQDDESLVAAVQQQGPGASEAYRLLVERYEGRVYRIAYEVLRSHEDAQDAVQETFVKAYLALKEFKGDSSFYTWLYRIAFNMAVDWKRKVARRQNNSQEFREDLHGDDGMASGAIEGPQAALLRKEKGAQIQRVLQQLSEEHRAVIMLREVEGLSYEEIADVVGVSKGTVMSRLFYARKKLQEALREFQPEGESVAHSASRAQNTPEHSEV